MRLTKRLLAMLLTVVMVLSMLPAIALTASAADTTETLTASDFAATTTSYASSTNVGKGGTARYAAYTAKKDSNIQFNKKQNCYIVSTTSGGKVKSVTVTISSGSQAIIVKGSNTAYTTSNAYSNGTEIARGTSTFTATPTTDYNYFAIVGNANGAVYISSVQVVWTSGANKTLSSISLSGSYPTSFTTGDTFDHTGMVVTATYSDSSTKNVTSSATWSSPNMSTAGTKTVTVSYTEGSTTKTATYDITVQAPTPTHTLSSAVSPSGGGSVSLSKTTVAEGATATATATANTGYTFTSWSISGTGASLSSTSANPTTVTMGTANATVTANFTAKTPAGALTLSEAGNTTAVSVSDKYVGDKVNLPNDADHYPSDTDYNTFIGWYVGSYSDPDDAPSGGSFYAPGAQYTLTGSAVTLKAVYAKSTTGGAAGWYKVSAAPTSGSIIIVSHGGTTALENAEKTNNKTALPSSTITLLSGGAIDTNSTTVGDYTFSLNSGTKSGVCWLNNGSSKYLKVLTDSKTAIKGSSGATDTACDIRFGGDATNGFTVIGDRDTAYLTSGFVSSTTSSDAGKFDIYQYSSGGGTTYSDYETDFKSLTSIALSGTYPTTFTTGDTFDHTGMVVTATYSDSSTENVTSSATWSSPDMSTASTKEVTVSYTYGGNTRTATYYITVTAPTYSFTAASNNSTWGTVTTSGSVITATPESGYRINSSSPYTVSPAGAATVTNNNDGTFTVSDVTATCTVTINFVAIPTYNVTYSNPTGGTITVQNSGANVASGTSVQEGTVLTLTATPSTGYTFGSWSVTGATPADGNATTTTITVTAATSISANFNAKTQYTLTYSANGATTTESPSPYGGDTVTLPSSVATPPTGYTFVGWLPDTYTNDTAPSGLLDPGSIYTMPNANTTLYAVYALGGGNSDYTLVTNTDQLSTGLNVVIAASGYNYAMSTTQNNNNRAQASITKNGSTITLGTGVCEFTLGEGTTSGTWSFYDAGNSGYICAASSGSNYLHTESTNTANGSFAISVTSAGVATVTAQGTYSRNTIRYNSSNNPPIFACYASDNTNQKDIALYVKSATSYSGYTTSPVVKTLSSISLSGTHPTAFKTGETFSSSGLVVTANYDNGDTQDVTASATVTAPDLSTSGSGKTVTVSYTESGVTVTASYTVDVTDAVATFEQNGTVAQGGTLTTVNASGGTLTFPALSSNVPSEVRPVSEGDHYGEYSFVGWTTHAAIVTPTLTAPTYSAPSDTTGLTADTTYRTVYRYAEETEASSTLKISITHDGTTYWVGTRSGTNAYLTAETNEADAASFVMDEVVVDGVTYWTLGYIVGNETNYIGNSGSSTIVFTTDTPGTDAKYLWTYDTTASSTFVNKYTERGFGLNPSVNPIRFAAYATTVTNSGNTTQNIDQPQGLSVSGGSGTTTVTTYYYITRGAAVLRNLIANDDTIVIDWALPVTFNVLTNDEIDVAYTMTPGTLPSGVVNNGEGSFTYTPSSMQQNNLTFTYTLTGNTGSGETSDQATVTLKVADTVYYEEGNSVFTYDGDWTEVSAGSPVSSLTDIPSDIPGYEAAYASYSTYSGGKAKKTTVSAITSTNPSVTFTFAGTGFDVISATTVTSGTIMVTVKDSGGAYATYPGGGKVNQIIDTYRGYSYSDGAWTPSHNASANYYQIPIIRATGLTYGTYTVEVKLIYSSSANHTGNESYDFFFDGVRIYNPVSGQAAEYKYLSIRDAVAAGGTGSGTVTGHSFSAWLHNENSSPSSHTRTCTDDGCSETETALCSFTSAVTTQPTGNTAGVRKYTCSGCGYFYTESIDPTGFDATYYVNGVQYGETEHVAYNGNPTFPTPSVTSYPASSGYSHDYVFQGWVAATISPDTATPGTIYTSSSNSCTLSADTSFYAVFKYNDDGGTTAFVTEASELAEGTYAIVAKRSTGNYFIMTSDLGTASTKRYQAADSGTTDSSTLLASTFEDNMKWVVEEGATSGTWYLKSVAENNYVTWSSGNSGDLSSTAYALTADDGVVFKSNADGTRQIMLNSSTNTNYFAFYTGTQTAMQLIRLGGSDYYATTVSFASHDYEATITPGSLALHPTGTGTTGTVSATLTDNNVEVTGVTPTYTSSDTSVATVAADGTVTAVANGTATITATYTVDGDDYTATCAVTVTTLATYNVTYYVNGDQYGQVESVTQGDSPSFTAPSTDVSEFNAHRYEFAGWKEASALSDDTSEAPTLYTAGSNKPINVATSFYAVYKYVESGGTVATQAMDLTNGNSGTYVIAANVNGTYYALPNSLTVTSNKIAGTALASVPGSTMTTSEASGYALTIAKSNDVWTIGNSNVKITYSDSTNIGTSSNGSSWTIVTGTHGSYRIIGQSGRALAYRNGNNVFGHYSTSNITTTSTEYYDVEIIPVVTGTTYYATTLSNTTTHTYAASMSSATLTIEAGEEEPVFGTLTDNGIVTNAYTPVYTSSNTSVATVSPTTGYVTGVAAGSATITVTYTVDGTPCTATCAVTVTAAQTVTTYTVRYYVNGSLYNTETIEASEHPSFDAPTTNVSAYDAHSYAFAGWADDTVSETTTRPMMYTSANASSCDVGSDVSFHAVYTWGTGGSGNYELVDASEATAGSYVIGALRSTTASNNYYFATGTVTTSTNFDMNVTSSSVTISGTSVAPTSLPSGTMVFTFTGDNTNGFTIATSGGDYLGYTTSSNRRLAFGSSYSTTKWAVADKSGSLNSKGTYLSCTTCVNDEKYTISENSTAESAIRGYASDTVYRAIYLFKLNTSGGGSATNYYTTTLAVGDGTTATLSVTPTTLDMTPGDYEELTVTAANGGTGAYVTATSSNTGIANVYALNDGNNSFGVSAGGTGSAIITLRYFDGSDNQLASVSVSVTVSSSSGGGSGVGTNADYGRVGSDGNAPTTSGSTNAGTRGVVCTSISQKAADYYSAKNTTWADLTALSGVYTTSSVDAASGNALKNKLQTLMTLNTTVSYSSLNTHWATTDKSNGSSQNLYIYSNVTSNSSLSREHVWPKSRGQFYESGAGSDLQHLRPEESTVNSTRSNHTMGYVNGVLSNPSTKTYGGQTVLWYNGSYSSNDCNGLVEVMDVCKGDVARILLYVYTEYPENTNLFTKTSGGGSGNNASDGNKVIESLNTLLEWCALDPVDTWEMSRNDAVQNIQGNRNVYIDYPELAWMIFNLTPPTTMQTPSGQGAAGNVGTRNSASYRSISATHGATRSIGSGSVPTDEAVMIDGLGQTNVAADIEAYGPKFGIYLAPSQGIVFTLQSADTTIETLALQLGAKAVNGAAGQIDVAAIGSASGNTAGFQYLMENQAITSATEMYYALDGDKLSWESGTSSVIVIYNSGTDVVAITNLRYPATNTLTMSISNSQVQRAVRMIREVYGLPETDPDPINDAPELDFRSASLALNSDIAINFYVDAAVYESIDAPYAVFTKALYNASGEVTGYATTTVSAATLTDNGYCFSFTGIRPDEMGSAVTAKLYGYRDGTLVEGDTCSYSVLSYVNRMANSSYANNADFRTLLADLVSYGAAAQTYTGYNTANLATAGVSADLMTNATAAAPSLTNRTAFAPNENESVSFVGAYLTLRDKVTVCYTIDVGDYDADALELLISYTDYDGTPKTVTIYGEDFTEANGLYVASFSELNAVQMRTVLSAEVFANGSCVSSTLTYSIESYAQSKASGGDALAALVNAMMKFGDSAMTYFAEEA